MLKRDEIGKPDSCWNRAKDDEPIFILLGRDLVARETIQAWADLRVEVGKNAENDPQIVEALAMAEEMDRYIGDLLIESGQEFKRSIDRAAEVMERVSSGLPALEAEEVRKVAEGLRRLMGITGKVIDEVSMAGTVKVRQRIRKS